MEDSNQLKELCVLDGMQLASGQYSRLYRMMYEYGTANGTLLLLPYDHGIEHGPIDFLDYLQGADPEYLFPLVASVTPCGNNQLEGNIHISPLPNLTTVSFQKYKSAPS